MYLSLFIDKIRAKALPKLTFNMKSLRTVSVPKNERKMKEKAHDGGISETTSNSHLDEAELFRQMEPKTRQQIKIVGRTLFCFRCDGSKEMASYYCACGSFLCTLHLAEHSCLVSASMQYNEELLEALC
jgi:hypothetical protein